MQIPDTTRPTELASSDTEIACENGWSTATRKRAAVAWDGLRQLYGTSFVSMYGDVPSWLWLEAIDQLTDAQIIDGLRRLRDTAEHSYPANCRQFVEACKPKPPGRRYLGTPICGSEARTQPEPPNAQLEPPTQDRAHIDACLDHMRTTIADGQTQRQSEILGPAQPTTTELLSGPALEQERVRQLKGLLAKANETDGREPGEDDA